MNINRPVRALALAGAAAALLGGGVAMASPSVSGASQTSTSSSPTAAPVPVQVTNFPGTQNVAGSVNVANLPATQNVAGTVNIANLPSTQTVAGSVAVTGGAVGIDPSANTVKLDSATVVAITAKTVPLLQHEFGTAGANSAQLDVSGYKTLIIDAKDGALPSGCTVTVTISDFVHPDNTGGTGFWIPNISGTVNGLGLHQTVEVASPTVLVGTSDWPVDCSLNVPLELGVFGRPN